ncbi:hypothetical protein JK386_04290 [Nocardioides sp. zg-536]|uniref:Uncharacterized protein n=1 Tax=Nocardioides faecalis TaxID=2803858 RepID=A0A938Y4I4_9ACTN|nr:hypothetical protein [Nocardioides faecalis]MBM9459110.1 hypothetical protein [Nocardioides faecalis]QVI57367.1 hypothetical protein KG111_09550 [Nocardioides faecalis]
MTDKIGWVVAGVVLLVLLLAGGVTALVVASGDPQAVEEVADAAVEAAEDLDIDAGADLLCEAPSSKDRKALVDLIEEARAEARTDDPHVTYDVTNIRGEAEGSFDVRITSDEKELADRTVNARVIVKSRNGRSCIADVEALD